MQEQSRYATGIDIGTTTIRCVVGHIDPTNGKPTIVGLGTSLNSGMRKGAVVNLTGPAKAIDLALGEAERMCGYEVNEATLSVNGSHITSTKADGMIAVGTDGKEVTPDDVSRLDDVATTGKIPTNREILEVVPFSYTLDQQSGIKDPVGMSGTRLEVSANVVSAMSPYVNSVQKAGELATVKSNAVIPSVVASAKAVLTEQQIESGVAVIDMGGSTTGVAVYEEGDLQYVGVIPVGGNNITNDLAIGLKTDPEIAERVKLQHAVASPKRENEGVSIKLDKEILNFNTEDIDEIVDARLEEIFELVNKELKKAGKAGQLPSGVVLVGGVANLKGITDVAKSCLSLSVKIGKPSGFGGVTDNIDKPEYATAIGLMLTDSEFSLGNQHKSSGNSSGVSLEGTKGFLKNIFARFKV